MAYTIHNFKTKKALKDAVQDYLNNLDDFDNAIYEDKDKPVRCYQPGLGPDLNHFSGTVYLEGPHYPEPHRWYAQAELKNGIVVKVK